MLVLGICLFILPQLIAWELSGDFDYGYMFVVMYITTIPFYIALYRTLELLRYVQGNDLFSNASVNAVKSIKICAYSISGIYAACMPYLFIIGDRDDAPGVVMLGFVVTFASFVIATASAVLQRVLQRAVLIKTENDLTV